MKKTWLLLVIGIVFSCTLVACGDDPFFFPPGLLGFQTPPGHGGGSGTTPPPADVDNDEDGVNDDVDNCPATYNPDQADLDQDGTGDACDLDADGDEVSNESDNCPTVANADQLDSDEDGQGDLCDETPFPDPTPTPTPTPEPTPTPTPTPTAAGCPLSYWAANGSCPAGDPLTEFFCETEDGDDGATICHEPHDPLDPVATLCAGTPATLNGHAGHPGRGEDGANSDYFGPCSL